MHAKLIFKKHFLVEQFHSYDRANHLISSSYLCIFVLLFRFPWRDTGLRCTRMCYPEVITPCDTCIVRILSTYNRLCVLCNVQNITLSKREVVVLHKNGSKVLASRNLNRDDVQKRMKNVDNGDNSGFYCSSKIWWCFQLFQGQAHL